MWISLFLVSAMAASTPSPLPEPAVQPQRPSPGQVVAIVFEDSPEQPWIKVEEKEFPVFRCPVAKKWCGLLAVPLGTHGKEFFFTTGIGERSNRIGLTLAPANYGSETLRVDPAKVKLNAKALKRVTKEREVLAVVYDSPETPLNWDGPFERPGKGKITSPFGRSRLFNGEVKSYHTGVDLNGNSKTPVLATNRGTVVLAQNLFFAGNVIIVDHGLGIFSTYGHLSRFSVKKGDKVKKGQKLGFVGATGRVTGPHLHFGIRIRGVLSDPLQMHSVVNPWWRPASQGG